MRLYNERFEDAVLGMADGSVDGVMVDPPFGTTSNRWDAVICLDFMWKHLRRVCKKDAPIVIKSVDPFSSRLVSSNFKAYKHKWYWRKNRAGNFAVAKHQPLSVVEELIVFCYGKLSYTPQMVKDKMRTIGSRTSNTNGQGFGGIKNISYRADMRHPQNVLDIPTVERKDSVHPSQTPVRLWEYMLNTYTAEGDVILDFAMGSGSVGIACGNLRRGYTGIESDKVYFEKAQRRVMREGTLFPLSK